MVAEAQVSSYTDFNALAQLKARAGTNDPSTVRETARQFEALFLQMMLTSMRDAGNVLAESRDRTYEEMFDQQIALELARRDSLGIGDLLLRQIDAMPASAAGGRTAGADEQQTMPAVGAVSAGLSTRRRSDFRPSGPREFVSEIWPLARQTADTLGVDPRAIVAQAALETGWGSELIRDARGVSGNNLFGIKADGDWRGERIGVATLEFEGSQFVPRHEQFRAYATLAEGFAGYERFLSGNARYAVALDSGANPGEFARSLQDAGYATDPDYAAKIERILMSDRFNTFVEQAQRRP